MHISRRRFLSTSAATAAGTIAMAHANAIESVTPVGSTPVRLNLGVMVWRIGDLLDFDAQVKWIADAGFESISFHASAGTPGQWRGIDPATTEPAERRRIGRLLSRFRTREIHAPFDAVLQPQTPLKVLARLEGVLEFAGDVGAGIVTVHADPPALDSKDPLTEWHAALDRLDTAAAKAEACVAMEFNSGFEWLHRPRRKRIGATLDVGHMYHNDGRGYQPYGNIGNQIQTLGDTLVHLHVHDYKDGVDHIEIGTGVIDFEDILRALARIHYQGALCLELNPSRVTPEGIKRSAAYLRARAR